ncbi:hypothetical protein Amsp01_010900 [Amycolatopsis sp. NBRC 101858]|nr:hypothetical protein Amsp01_010900 [Amycolatopsis sp. NBRC 101858]
MVEVLPDFVAVEAVPGLRVFTTKGEKAVEGGCGGVALRNHAPDRTRARCAYAGRLNKSPTRVAVLAARRRNGGTPETQRYQWNPRESRANAIAARER